MRTTVRKEVAVCDICGRETPSNILDTCILCGKEFCMSCQIAVYNVYNMEVCNKCYKEKPAVQAIIEKRLNLWRNAREKIAEQLKRVGK